MHVEKAPPKHSLAAMAAVASRRERQQDSVMGQMQTRAAEVRSLEASQVRGFLDSSAEFGCVQVAAASAGPEENYQEIHTCHLYGVDEVMSAYQKTMRRNQVSPKPSEGVA